MPGIVKADPQTSIVGSRKTALVPRACPCISASNRPRCVEVSFQSGWTNLCPFFYGSRVIHGGMIADVRGTSGMLTWLSEDRIWQHEYEVLCLRKEGANSIAGAHLRD